MPRLQVTNKVNCDYHELLNELENKPRENNITIGDTEKQKRFWSSVAKMCLSRKKYLRLAKIMSYKNYIFLDFNQEFVNGNLSAEEYERFFERNTNPFAKDYCYELSHMKVILNIYKKRDLIGEISLEKIFSVLKPCIDYTFDDFVFIFELGLHFDETKFFGIIGKRRHIFSIFLIKYALGRGYPVSNFAKRTFVRELKRYDQEEIFFFRDLEIIHDVANFEYVEEYIDFIANYCQINEDGTPFRNCDFIVFENIKSWVRNSSIELSNGFDKIEDEFFIDYIIRKRDRWCQRSYTHKIVDVMDDFGFNRKPNSNIVATDCVKFFINCFGGALAAGSIIALFFYEPQNQIY